MSLPCPACKADIDDDSFFCDQCGTELMKCGRCGFVGKGKVCPHDKTPLMPAKALAGGIPPQPLKTVQPAGASTSTSTSSSSSTVGAAPAMPPGPATPPAVPTAAPGAAASATGPGAFAAPVAATVSGQLLCLRSAAHGVELRAASGDVLGRRFGAHAAVLSRFSQISSNHLQLRRDGAGAWFAKDMNSFNHSFYNGVQLAPGQEQQLNPGGVLSLGDVAFTVCFE